MPKSKPNKRSSRYIDSEIQGNLMLRLIGYWVVYNIALLSTMAGSRLVLLVPELLKGNSAMNSGELFSNFGADTKPLLFAMAIFCPVLIWDMLRYSHRVAGPIYRFRKSMQEHIDGGDLQTVKLRDDDLLDQFEATYNEFVQHVKQQRALAVAEAAAVTPTAEPEKLQEV